MLDSAQKSRGAAALPSFDRDRLKLAASNLAGAASKTQTAPIPVAPVLAPEIDQRESPEASVAGAAV